MSAHAPQPNTRAWSRRALLALGAASLMAGCAHPVPEPRPETRTGTGSWSGRLALTVESEPVQAFSASFNLSGDEHTGELQLSSPLGSTLALMQWSPGQALLRQGDGPPREYASLDELALQATGAELPVRALFDWLRGIDRPVPGWQADLSQLQGGRLSARRLMPLPTAQLRVVLDR